VREDHEDHAGEHADPDLRGRPLGGPLVDESEQRRRRRDPRGEPHSATLPRSPIESKKEGSAPTPVANAVTSPATKTNAIAFNATIRLPVRRTCT